MEAFPWAFVSHFSFGRSRTVHLRCFLWSRIPVLVSAFWKARGKLLCLSVCLSVKMGWRLGACNCLANTAVRFKAHYFISRLVSVCEFSTECLKGSKPSWYQENIYFWGMNSSFESHFCIPLLSVLEYAFFERWLKFFRSRLCTPQSENRIFSLRGL